MHRFTSIPPSFLTPTSTRLSPFEGRQQIRSFLAAVAQTRWIFFLQNPYTNPRKLLPFPCCLSKNVCPNSPFSAFWTAIPSVANPNFQRLSVRPDIETVFPPARRGLGSNRYSYPSLPRYRAQAPSPIRSEKNQMQDSMHLPGDRSA